MNIVVAQKNDALEIARIHKTEISQGFLSSLPLNFLEKLYICVVENDFCVVAKDGEQIIGFIAGTGDIKKLYKYFLRKYFFVAIILLLPKVLDIKRILETLFYPKKESGLPEAELLTIAVKKEFQSQGVAGQMFDVFIRETKNRSISEFKVLVGEDLAGAIKFYEKKGFKFVKETIIHNNKKSKIYVFTN